MTQLAQTSQFSMAAYNKYKIENSFVQIIVFIILALSILLSFGVAFYCVSRGGNLSWAYQFGIFLKVACKFNR